MINEQLYFIAIIPPEPIMGEVQKMKENFASNYGATHALKSPPHITLIPPFKANPVRELEIIKFLKEKAYEINSFCVSIKNFACFKPKVIFLNPILSQELEIMQGKIESSLYETIPVAKHAKRPFHPHLTIAFRDLSQEAFYHAWPVYKEQTYIAEFTVDRICLLRHNGTIWEEFKEFIFGDAILPR